MISDLHARRDLTEFKAATRRISHILEQHEDSEEQPEESRLLNAVAGMQASLEMRSAMLKSIASSVGLPNLTDDDDDFYSDPLRLPSATTWEDLLMQTIEGRDRLVDVVMRLSRCTEQIP